MYSLSIKSTPENTEKVRLLLYQHISWGWEEEDRHTSIIHFSGEKAAADFKERILYVCPDCLFELKPVQDKDWTEDWKQYFTPIQINDTFVVLPEWLEKTPSSLIKIIITPKMAFGTGHHPTTSLCLKTLSSLFNRGIIKKEYRFLDLGTGSGILGIAAAKLGLSGIGLDVDDSAIENARENITLNKVESRFKVSNTDVRTLNKDAGFNLIFANILASTLTDLAPGIVSLLDEERHCLVLSGLLKNQADDVVNAYVSLGLGMPGTLSEGEWSALVWTSDSG